MYGIIEYTVKHPLDGYDRIVDSGQVNLATDSLGEKLEELYASYGRLCWIDLRPEGTDAR